MIFSKIKEAVEDFRSGKFVIVLDNKDREDEADLVLAAEKATPEKINFMIKNARGLVCVPMLGSRLDELRLPLMTNYNTEYTKCAFTISVDAKKVTKTGISAFDRAATIKTLIDPKSRPEDLARPGHIFPLRASENGLDSRKGHTEASLQLCRMAKLYPAAVICEMVGDDGWMANINELAEFSKRHKIRMIGIQDIIDKS